MKSLSKHPVFILTLVCVGIFFVNLDALIVNIMEARNFTTAREMINDGNWILTTLNGEPRYQKPPLPTWLTALSAMLFGLKNLFALRLPAAIMGLITVVYTYKLGTRFTKNRTYGFIAGLIAATSFYIVFAGRNGQWDIFTHAFMMVCIYKLFQFFSKDEKKYQNALLAALFFGASFMSKGPVSLYALMLPFLISFGIVFKYRSFKQRIIPLLLFLVVGLLISGWWHWYTYTFDPQAVSDITQKETSNWTGYNVRPFYYYWSFFTQSGLWTLPAFIGLLYPYLKNRVFHKKGYRFTFWWTILAVVLLSIIPEKKSRYLLPVLIPLALNTAFYIEYLFRKFALLKDKKETFPVYFQFGILGLIGIVFPVGGYLFIKEQLSGNWVWFILLSVALFSIGIFIFLKLKKKEFAKVFYASIAFIIAVMCFGMPLANSLTYNPEYKSLSELNQWQEETNLQVYELEAFTPELIWAYGKTIRMVYPENKNTLPKEKSFGLLVSEDRINQLQKSFKEYSVEKIIRYDMNTQAPGERTHRPRLWRDLYVLTKKEL